MVTSYPRAARSPAQAMPAGPEPITATFLPLGSTSGAWMGVWASCQSETKRSTRPMATASPFRAWEQFFSHCCSWGHTRPQMPGRLLCWETRS